jgi:hypothetical protein
MFDMHCMPVHETVVNQPTSVMSAQWILNFSELILCKGILSPNRIYREMLT